MCSLKKNIHNIIDIVIGLPKVIALGVTDDMACLIASPISDIDIFVYCTEIPDADELKSLLKPYYNYLTVHVSEKWGCGFHGSICEKDVSLMFFCKDKTISDINLTLAGKQINRHSDGYYPIGRCATILNMNIIYDKENYLELLQERLACYPENLKALLVDYHKPKINDIEDFTRAVARKDVLFYHYVLDSALDHFLQMIFAKNGVYFPSRKRSFEYMEKFTLRPKNFRQRFLDVIRLGSMPETLEESYKLWCLLCDDLLELISIK